MRKTEGLKIIYLRPEELTPYPNNARKHSRKDIDAIKRSIEEFDFLDPIGIYGDKKIIVEGHGRQIAAMELGKPLVPCIRLDHLTDEQRKAYTLAHNKTAELSDWDFKKLDEELDEMKSSGFDMSDFGFDMSYDILEDEVYSGGTNPPRYEPTGTTIDVSELVNTEKYDSLVKEINASDLPENEKEFLRLAAARHIRFNYRNIAEYYCNASAATQRLMENSALVIIDIDDAIKNGYAVLTEKLKKIARQDEECKR